MMSGNFAGHQNLEELKAFFPIDYAAGDLTITLEIAPGREILAIVREAGQNRLENFHWGMVPFWAKDASIGNRLINARAETIAEKPSFREAFKSRRCLIPATGFYEWQGQKGAKQPVFITLPDHKPFAFAGLWESWQSKRGGDTPYKSCTIITTRASRSFSSIHHRMPVILKPEVYPQWLDPANQDRLDLIDLLKREIITELVCDSLTNQTGAKPHIEPARVEAAGKARQTTFAWPVHEKDTSKK